MSARPFDAPERDPNPASVHQLECRVCQGTGIVDELVCCRRFLETGECCARPVISGVPCGDPSHRVT